MARLGNIEFVLIREDRTYENEVTSHPVERGSDVTDHVMNQPLTFQIEGEYTGPDAGRIHGEFVKLFRSGEPVYYSGRAAMANAVIENFTSSVDENIANGFHFSLTLKNIRIARPSVVGLLPATLRADVSEVKNVGRVQPR